MEQTQGSLIAGQISQQFPKIWFLNGVLGLVLLEGTVHLVILAFSNWTHAVNVS